MNTLSSLPPRESLYLEAVKVAKVLARRAPRDEDAWKRFEELYWSELPLAKESLAMESAMVGFRQSVINAQEAPRENDNKEWGAVNKALLHLSRVVSAEVPNKTIQPTAESGG